MKKFSLALAILVPLSGCATQSFNLSEDKSGSYLAYDKMQNFFVGGLGQESTVDASSICGSGDKVSKVQSELTFINGLLGSLTYSIYAPKQSRVFCEK
ncbi:MAG: Bor family protein [Pseudomonadota bacterium]|nr:Bor family protein [Pseudomonadota bacterium]